MADHASIDHTGITGTGGSVATDTIWDAAGDLAVGSGANTAAKLTKGSNGDVLTVTAGAVGWAAPAGGGASGVEWFLVPESGATNVSSAAVGAANRGLIIPVVVRSAVEVTGFRLRVASGSTGTVSVALYDSSLARVATSGSVACPANGLATVSFTGNYSAAAGLYYMGLSCSSNSPTFVTSSAAATAGPLHSFFMETAHPLPDPFVSAGASPVVPSLLGLLTGGWTP